MNERREPKMKKIIIELRISRPTKNKLNAFEPSSNKRYVIYSMESFDINEQKKKKKKLSEMNDMEQKMKRTSTTTGTSEYH